MSGAGGRVRRVVFPLSFVLVACADPRSASQPAATATATATAITSDSALRAELLRRVEADQAARERFVARLREGTAIDSATVAEMQAVDTVNTRWMADVLARRGWPGRGMVGEEAANAAFLLVQHADLDTALQVRALPLLERAYRAGEATGQQYALLADRVAAARGEPQVYGTQTDIRDGHLTFKPIADSAQVDARRAAVGLPSLAEYRRVLDSVYMAPPPG